jgi:hypothetical protein
MIKITCDNCGKEIEKIDLVIEQWEAKKAPLQLLVDKYNEINYGK